MTKIEKAKRIQEIKELVQEFCNRHLNEELAGVWEFFGRPTLFQFLNNPFRAGS